MHAVSQLKTRIGKSKWIELCDFLENIQFISIINDINYDVELTKTGKEYYKFKFILHEYGKANKILSDALKRYQPTQAICQLLWGKPELNRKSVYKLLVLENYIHPYTFKETDLGSFLMLLNQSKILKYSKKTNSVVVLYNPRTEEELKSETSFISPETPYSNIRKLWDIIRNCSSFIYWIDKHFSAKGLEPLADEADGNKIKEIKILTGITSSGVNERLRRDFSRFREEMKTRQITSELRVICDKNLLRKIHDRWILSEKACFNIPPINTIFQGQYSEMKKTKNRPPFEEWWEKGLDIIDKWDAVDRSLQSFRSSAK